MVRAPVSLVIVGIGGMGSVYVRELLDRKDTGLFRIAGAVDPEPGRCRDLEELRALDVPCYASLPDFYRNRSAELAVISSPIQYHREQTLLALGRGSHVLCEKPIAGTIQEAREMIAAEKGSPRWVAVGYQWSFSRAIQSLKKDIASGIFGKARRLKCLYLWPRDEAYYGRNSWAGRKRGPDGKWVLDSPAQNAMAHDLHNMFYVLGSRPDSGAMPAEVQAELYRANPIDNFDTAAARAFTDQGVEILFYVTHASRREKGPALRYEFEKAVIRCDSRISGVWAEFPDGSRRDYGHPDAEPMAKLWQSIAGVREAARPLCGLEASAGQTLCLNGMQESVPEIADFDQRLLRWEVESGNRRVWVEGVDEALERAWEAGALPSEVGIDWSVAGRKVDLRGYSSFPGS